MPTNLRVIHVVDSLRPGGMENGLVNMATRLADRGVETHVACLVASGEFAGRLPNPDNVHVMGKADGFSWRAVRNLRQVFRDLSPDLVHTHNLGPLIYTALASFGGLQVPILHGEHGQIQAHERNTRRRWQRRLLYSCCKRVHTVSRSMIAALDAEGLPTKNVTAVVNGVDSDRFQPADSKEAARLRVGLPEKARVLGVVGRFVGLKRHIALLEALEVVMSDLPDLFLLVVGDHGDAREAVVAKMESHPQKDRIVWPGMQKDTLPYYQAMDMLVSPSEIEGLSNVVLEAMSCGVPVLAHDACGNTEVIVHEENGFCDDLGSVPKLATALKSRLSDPARLQRVGECARSHVRAGFSLESMADGYWNLYRECAR